MKRISSMRPEERRAVVGDLLDELGKGGGVIAVSQLALVTYEAVRGMTAPTELRAHIVGLAYDVARQSHVLTVIDDKRLKTIPLTTLVSVTPIKES